MATWASYGLVALARLLPYPLLHSFSPSLSLSVSFGPSQPEKVHGAGPAASFTAAVGLGLQRHTLHSPRSRLAVDLGQRRAGPHQAVFTTTAGAHAAEHVTQGVAVGGRRPSGDRRVGQSRAYTGGIS